VVICTARGIHAQASKIHSQERVVHSPARGHRNEAQSRSPCSWIDGDAGGGARFGRRLMVRSRSGFESVELQDSKKPAGGASKETIHDAEEAGEEVMVQLLILEGQG
jgi:hypothetical protein